MRVVPSLTDQIKKGEDETAHKKKGKKNLLKK